MPAWDPSQVRYVPVPVGWRPVDEGVLRKWSATELRLATALFVAGLVAVFVYQMPLLAQIVVGAPLFEEAFKAGLALLPWAAFGVRSLWARVPTAAAIGAGFGAFEHTFTYPDEPMAILAGRIAFHALAACLSVVVLDALRGADGRLGFGCILPSVLLHAANNALAVLLSLVAFAAPPQAVATIEAVSLGIGAAIILALAAAIGSEKAWTPGYRRILERNVLARLR